MLIPNPSTSKLVIAVSKVEENIYNDRPDETQ